jgi:hypothetical protein
MLAPNTPEPRRQKVEQSRPPVHCEQVAWPDYSPALSRVIPLLPPFSTVHLQRVVSDHAANREFGPMATELSDHCDSLG